MDAVYSPELCDDLIVEIAKRCRPPGQAAMMCVASPRIRSLITDYIERMRCAKSDKRAVFVHLVRLGAPLHFLETMRTTVVINPFTPRQRLALGRFATAGLVTFLLERDGIFELGVDRHVVRASRKNPDPNVYRLLRKQWVANEWGPMSS
jgi:hypothetical protein